MAEWIELLNILKWPMIYMVLGFVFGCWSVRLRRGANLSIMCEQRYSPEGQERRAAILLAERRVKSGG